MKKTKSPYKKIIADNIRNHRKALGITQIEAARRSQMDIQKYRRIESAKTEFNFENIIRITIALETTPNDLLGYHVNSNAKLLLSPTNIPPRKTLSENLKRLRNFYGISQAEFIKKANYKKQVQTYNRYETRNASPSAEELIAFAETFSCTPNELLGFPTWLTKTDTIKSIRKELKSVEEDYDEQKKVQNYYGYKNHKLEKTIEKISTCIQTLDEILNEINNKEE